MHYLLQSENHYQRYEWTALKPWRMGKRYQLIRNHNHTTMLVNEEYFDYYSYTISLTSPTPFAVKDLKEIIRQKYLLLQQKYWRTDIVRYYFIDGCMQEYCMTNHVLGKTWNLSFVLRVMVLQHGHTLELQKHTTLSKITLIPKHLWLIQRIHYSLTKPFTLLHFSENEIACLSVKWWWYTSIDTLPFGLSLLRESFKDHDLSAYLYNDIDRIEKNPLLRKSVEEVMTFFLTQVIGRMHQHAILGVPCVVITRFASHAVFMKILQQLSVSYQATSFIPFTSSLIQEDTQDIEALIVKSWHTKQYKKKTWR